MNSESYPRRFIEREVAQSYDACEYASTSYSSLLWAIQRPVLRGWLERAREQQAAPRHLDFACGTGRITRLTEEVFDQVDGLDISEEMIDRARQQCAKAHFYVGSVLDDPDLCRGPYTSITTFRLILNLDASLRLPILRRLHTRLAPDGTLIFNIHGNTHSLRQPAILWKRLRHPPERRGNLMLNSMSDRQVRELLREAGFQVEERWGVGMLPPTVYRWPLRRFWAGLDRMLARAPFLRPFCVDLMYRCSRRCS
jgi:SAM-dependent methyltransferase